ncbi:MAG: DUF962 domain-containing protein [Alphaproteobacteria bacterium]|nr:DUF962 domain-containing protein [Alphaproteobacteria bacterium]
MSASNLFVRQLASYAAAHRDARNKATHFVGIPTIVFSLLLVLTLWRIPLGAATVSGALALGVLAVLGWVALDIGIGLVIAGVLLPLWLAAEGLAGALETSGTWTAFAGLFVGGWILQFLGHHYEGRRPALLDNLFQAFIGPMFLVVEVMVRAGWRRDLADVLRAAGSPAGVRVTPR